MTNPSKFLEDTVPLSGLPEKIRDFLYTEEQPCRFIVVSKRYEFSMGKARPREDASTRADRKFEKKVQFYSKVRDTVASLSAQKAITKVQRRKKKLQAYDLSSLSEFLPELEAHQKPKAELKLNRKTKQKLVLKEGDQLRAVIGHPAFQSNPLQAIYQHLQGTQPLDNEKRKRDRKKGKGKKKKSKPQLMET